MAWLRLLIIRRLFRILDAHIVAHALGEVFLTGRHYQADAAEVKARHIYIPDLLFIRADHIPQDFDWTNTDKLLVPALVVEVILPGQKLPEILKHVAYYLELGSEEVWVIHPKKQLLTQFRFEDPPIIYSLDEAVEVAPLFGDLVLRVSDLFVTP